MRIKKVIIFRSTLLPISETFVLNQASALQTWRPVLLGLKNAKAGLDISAVNSIIASSSTSRLSDPLHFWLNKPLPRLKAIIQNSRADLMHVHFGTDAVDIWPTAHACNLPVVVTLHGFDINVHRAWWESGSGGARRKNYPDRLLQMAKSEDVKFIAVSNAIREKAIAFGIQENKIETAYIGVDQRYFKPSRATRAGAKKKILFVGRMVEKKGPLLLLQALKAVVKHVPDIDLFMIGDGPLKASAQAFALEHALPVTFLGSCDRSKVLNQLRSASIFCLPSITANNGDAEGLPISILEAQACAIDVVTSAKGADETEPLNSKTILVPEGDLEALTQALIERLRDPRSAEPVTYGEASIGERFHIENTTAHLERIYQTAARIHGT